MLFLKCYSVYNEFVCGKNNMKKRWYSCRFLNKYGGDIVVI